MRIGTIAVGGATVAAVLSEDGAIYLDDFEDVGALLRAGALERAQAATKADAQPFEIENLRRPVLDPGVVIGVGLNYASHILEMGRELPEHPTLFGKITRALADPCADVRLPRLSQQVDYEGELVIVIGKAVRNACVAEALGAIAGYTLMNDVSMRDFQYRSLQWFAGKNFERSTPVGPWMVTADELDGLTDRTLSVTVNGEQRQRALFHDLVFEPASLIADISQIVTLEPGDLIATGTPGGVGYGMEPKRFLSAGDVVEVAVDGIGTLRTRFVVE